MISKVVLAIGFIVIWYIVVLPLSPQLLSSITNMIENSGVPLELTYTVSTPKIVYDNETHTNKTVWVEQPYKINFKPVIYILLIITFYIGPLIGVYKILKGGRHR